MLVRAPPPPAHPQYHFDHGYTAGVHQGRVEAETTMAIMTRAEMDESFRAGFAEGARLGYVNGYMQGSGDCAAAVVAHENATPEAAPAPFANLRTHLDLLTSVACRPALPPPPVRPLLPEPPGAALARADAMARDAAIARDCIARDAAMARDISIARDFTVARDMAITRDCIARDAFARDAALRDATLRADAVAAAARADAAAVAASARARATALEREAATPPSSVLRSRYSAYPTARY